MTPKKGTPPPSGGPRLPRRIGPFAKPDPDAALGQVGRRPSSPKLLAIYAAVFFASGILAFVVLSGSLGIIVGVVMIGVSLLWLRGAATAYLRQRGPSSPP